MYTLLYQPVCVLYLFISLETMEGRREREKSGVSDECQLMAVAELTQTHLLHCRASTETIWMSD